MTPARLPGIHAGARFSRAGHASQSTQLDPVKGGISIAKEPACSRCLITESESRRTRSTADRITVENKDDRIAAAKAAQMSGIAESRDHPAWQVRLHGQRRLRSRQPASHIVCDWATSRRVSPCITRQAEAMVGRCHFVLT
ncbi:hypothetical protein DPEC_G00068360 [Dallia pectoralis]|uniref:Uncharacterized protein n=1 Tax=Dallia pectoralis TaxID=75939 RepID=A0ACC2H1G9_DALPE|nr:hypothetical protein DPEC_G00068360 [Dallia pectoralis]